MRHSRFCRRLSSCIPRATEPSSPLLYCFLRIRLFPLAVFAQSSSQSGNLRGLAGAGELAVRDLQDRGISLHGTMIYDWSKELEPEESEAGFGRYSFDVVLPVDGKKLFGLTGSAGMVRVRHHLNNFGEDSGGVQLYSNIDASSRTTLYEAWIEQLLFSERIRFKFGKIDANTEFAAVQTAGDFLNSSMGFSPQQFSESSTYPKPQLGLNAFYRPTPNNTIGIGIFRTASTGTLTIAEPARSWTLGRRENPGRVSAGYWHLGGTIDRFDGKTATGTNGFYSVLEQTLWHRSQKSGRDGRVSAFLQFGTADGRVSPYQHHFGSGTVVQGIVHKRPQDSIGTAITWVHFSSQPAAHFEYPGELILESYYKAVVTGHIAVIQDFQFLHHPGGMKAHPDCPVLTPRVLITF